MHSIRHLSCLAAFILIAAPAFRVKAAPATAPSGNHKPAADEKTVAERLDRALPTVRVDQVALSDVIDFLRDVSEANIVVNW